MNNFIFLDVMQSGILHFLLSYTTEIYNSYGVLSCERGSHAH